MSPLRLSTSYKYHLLVALIIAAWLIAFLVLIAPFDVAELPFSIRLEIMPMYGLISFVAYMVLIPFQNMIFRKSGKWTIFLETILILLFNIIAFSGSYLYYKSGVVNGEYSFVRFALEVYYPIFFILLPMLIFARWYLNKKAPNQDSDKIVLKGENKLDVLQINFSDLICIASADNYVEINYLKNSSLSKKLLRNTLKNIHYDFPNLIKVHRSHLINPAHIREWKNSNLVSMTGMEVPVSKNYKQAIMNIQNSPLKL